MVLQIFLRCLTLWNLELVVYLIDSLALPLVFCGKISIHEHLPWYDILHWPFVMLIVIHDTPRRCRHEFYYSYLTALYAYHETSLASRVVAYSIFTTAICKNASVFPRCIISTIKNPELYRFDKLFWFFFWRIWQIIKHLYVVKLKLA